MSSRDKMAREETRMRTLLLASFLCAVSGPAFADVIEDTDAGSDTDVADSDSGCSTVPGGDVAAVVMLLSSLAVGRRLRR